MTEFPASRTITFNGQAFTAGPETLLLTCRSEVKGEGGTRIAELTPIDPSFTSLWVPYGNLNKTLQGKMGGTDFHVDFTFALVGGRVHLLSLIYKGEEIICYSSEAAARSALTGAWYKRLLRGLMKRLSSRVRMALLRQAVRLP